MSDTEVYLNRFLNLELSEVAYKIATKERFGNNRARGMRATGPVLRRAGRLAERLPWSWDGILANFTWARAEVLEVADEVPSLMRRGLASYDAVHASTVLKLDVDHLVTTDSGFGLVRPSDLFATFSAPSAFANTIAGRLDPPVVVVVEGAARSGVPEGHADGPSGMSHRLADVYHREIRRYRGEGACGRALQPATARRSCPGT